MQAGLHQDVSHLPHGAKLSLLCDRGQGVGRSGRAAGNCFSCNQPDNVASDCCAKGRAPPPKNSSRKSFQESSVDSNPEVCMDVRIRQKGGSVFNDTFSVDG